MNSISGLYKEHLENFIFDIKKTELNTLEGVYYKENEKENFGRFKLSKSINKNTPNKYEGNFIDPWRKEGYLVISFFNDGTFEALYSSDPKNKTVIKKLQGFKI